MGNAPGSVPPSQGAANGGEQKGKSQGAEKFRLTCTYHGEVGVFESREDGFKAASDHLHTQHKSAVESKSAGASVELAPFTSFGVADLEGYEKPKQ
jgi:hypothetical protein